MMIDYVDLFVLSFVLIQNLQRKIMLHLFSLNQLLLVALVKLAFGDKNPNLVDAIANYLLISGTDKQKEFVERLVLRYD
jgi:hypothetical protein